ncbi:SMP-30/gluconolactonase/LRE family protein [Olleya sp. YSTF-M6]|uniref:SMP-30/gluconolactonase/LRE family protein n=2 Tax=Olleya sediminilitoris TaxID=2795739 RepID=A0ABS1WKU5_9FLAO|nr:SMP-30/gluconolactonase/LRE family protein [Olleya sediminilitoris]
MKKILILSAIALCTIACKTDKKQSNITTEVATKTDTLPVITEVAQFTGQQVTGVTVSETGRMFVNFPRWRPTVKHSVTEIVNGQSIPFPNKNWNNWTEDATVTDSTFVAVQSVVASQNELFVVDTRNPMFKGVISNPKIFVFDLQKNALKQTFTLTNDVFFKDSYINDVRIDRKNNVAYFTDSGHAGLIILNLESGIFKRVLTDHKSTTAEVDHLTINGKQWVNTVHSDGIALNQIDNTLYFHALTGYTLYAVSTDVLINGTDQQIEAAVEVVDKTAAPDGMIFDQSGNLYYADLENNAILKRDLNGKTTTIAKGDLVRWADTFSIYNDTLYYTNSRINEISGPIPTMTFQVNKISLK